MEWALGRVPELASEHGEHGCSGTGVQSPLFCGRKGIVEPVLSNRPFRSKRFSDFPRSHCWCRSRARSSLRNRRPKAVPIWDPKTRWNNLSRGLASDERQARPVHELTSSTTRQLVAAVVDQWSTRGCLGALRRREVGLIARGGTVFAMGAEACRADGAKSSVAIVNRCSVRSDGHV
jgi:hypothetical protein